MIDTRTFNYAFTQRDTEGALKASSDLFYGPWESIDSAIESIKNALGTTDTRSIPDGANVAIWENTQHTLLKEYFFSGGVLVNKSQNGITSYTKTIFAYYLGETDSSPMFKEGSTTEMKEQLALGNWSLSIPESYNPDLNVLTVSFATFKVSGNTYTRINPDHSLYEGESSWENIFRVGGGVGSSTLIQNSIYRFDITNDNAYIPTNEGLVTREALKLATNTILTAYLNGDLVDGEDISDVVLETIDDLPFTINYTRSQTSRYTLQYWLEPKNGESEIRLIPGLSYNLPIAISIGGDTASGILILRIHVSNSQHRYNLISSPNIINVTKTFEFPALSFIAEKVSWDGVESVTSSLEDFNIELSIVGDSTESKTFTSVNSSIVLDDSDYSDLLANKTSYNTLKATLKVDNEVVDTDYLPIFFLSNLVGSANRDLTIDILNDDCQVGELFIGDLTDEAKEALKILTTGKLLILYKGKPLDNAYYNIISVEDTKVTEERNIYEYQKDVVHGEFYITKLFHASTAKITFEYVNPDETDKTLELAKSDGDDINRLTYFQSVNIVKDGADAEFYRFNVFPAVIWKDDNIFNPDQLDVYAYKIKGTTLTLLGGADNKSLDGYKYKVKYGDQEGLIESFNSSNKITLDSSNHNASSITITFYDNNEKYLDSEKFDINKYPKDGQSPYLILTNNPTIIIDDDSSRETIEAISLSTFLTFQGGTEISNVNYSLDTNKCELYDKSYKPKTFGEIFVLKKGEYCLTFSDDFAGNNLNNQYYTGKVAWKATTQGGDELGYVYQTLKVYDISNGETYFLNITPNVLYFDQHGDLNGNMNTEISMNIVKLQDGITENIPFDNNNYVVLENVTVNQESITTKDNYFTIANDIATIDFDNNILALPLQQSIIAKLYINNQYLISGTIYQAIQGDAAVSIDSGYTISIDNDYICIDDQATNDDLKAVSETNITILKDGKEISLTDADVNISISSNIGILVKQDLNNELKYHLEWENGDLDIHEKKSARIVITITFDDGLNHINIQKVLSVLILDFSQGEVYKLLVSPNYVLKNLDNTLSPSRLRCSVKKIYKGLQSDAIISGIGNEVNLKLLLYKWTNRDNTIENLDITPDSNPYITTSSDKEWLAESGSDLILLVDKIKGKDNIIPDFIEVQILKNNKIVDSETIQSISEAQNGVDGNSIEYVYLQTEDVDNTLWIDNINDYGFYYDVDNNPVLILLSDAHAIQDVMPIIKLGKEYESFIGWSDEPKGVSKEMPFEYMSKRTYDGKTQRWSDFSQPVLWAKYGQQGQKGDKGDKGDDGISPYMLSIDNDNIIIDNNATLNTIKIASLTDIKLYQGIQEIKEKVTVKVVENNQIFDTGIDNGLHFLKKIDENNNLPLGTYPVEYLALINGSVVASAVQSVKVIDVTEDGSSFRLLLSNDVLYRENKNATGSDSDITIQLQKITGNLSAIEYIDLIDNRYIIKVNDSLKNAATGLTDRVVLEGSYLSNLTAANGNIVVEARYKEDPTNLNDVGILLDREIISFAIKGDPGKDGEDGNDGNPGLNGCTIRHHYQSEGHPLNGYIYHNDESLADTLKYIDIIIFDKEPIEEEATTRYPVLICNTTHEYIVDESQKDPESIPPKWKTIWRQDNELKFSNYWNEADINEGFAFFNYVDALNARIENLVAKHATTEELVIVENVDDKPTTIGKFTSDLGNNNDKPLWIGGTTALNAKFWVDKNGNGSFSGKLTFSNSNSKFYGTSIAKEVEVKLSNLDPIEDTANYYINPLDYGVNVVIINDIGPESDIYNQDINIYIDIPAYELSSLLPDTENPSNESKITTNVSDGYKYIRYCNTFIGLTLRLVCKSVYSKDLTSKEANVYYRGLLSHYNELSSNTTSEFDLLGLLNSSTSDDSYASYSINKFNKASNTSPYWRIPTYQIGESLSNIDNASYPKFHTETVYSKNVEFILSCHKYNIGGKEYVVWLSEMHQQLGDYMNYEIADTIDKTRLITRDITN